MTFRSQLQQSLKTHAGVFERASVIERAPFHMTNKHSLSWSKGTLFVQPFPLPMLKLIPFFLRYRLYFANTVASLSSMLNCYANCFPITACLRGSAATHHVSCQSLSDSSAWRRVSQSQQGNQFIRGYWKAENSCSDACIV